MMDKSAADAYVYAKVSGILANSYSGKNADKLYSAKSLTELYSLLFKTEVPSIPENLLAKKIEEKSVFTFVEQYCQLVECYAHPQKILLTLLRLYDYSNLKMLAGALCMQETKCPEVIDLGKYSLLNYKNWPNLAKITENGELSWYNKVPDISDPQVLDTTLDFQYLHSLWKDACSSEQSIRTQIKSLVAEEIKIRNIVWALRLKIYYKMDNESICQKLFFENPKSAETDVFAGEALKILSKDISNFDEWKTWKYSKMLNPHEEGVFWEVDPRWLENSFRTGLVKKYSTAFHKYPLTSLSLVCFFKIKQDELNNIRHVTEELRLGGE